MPVRLSRETAMAHPLEEAFPFLSEEHLELLLQRSREEQYEPGDVIVAEGAALSTLYVIASGTVSVEKDHLGGGVSIAELGPGGLFGEVSYLDGSPTSASVVARTAVSAHVLEELEELLSTDTALASGFYRSLAVLLAGRLRFGNEERVWVVSALQWG